MAPDSAELGAALRRARQLMSAGELLPAGLIDAPVERSWRRCLAAGLAPLAHRDDAPHLSGGDLRHATESQHDLLANARPIMEYLHSQIQGSGSMIILADAQGFLLHALGDSDFLSRAARVALMPGASWHEHSRGTNAIGTALAEAAPVIVHGPEHYLECNAFLTCAASPVFGPTGRLSGVLDMSSGHGARHPHTFGLVRTAAQMLGNRLFDAACGKALRIHLHPKHEGIGTLAEGLIAVSEEGIVQAANQTALAFLKLHPQDLGVVPLELVLQIKHAEIISLSHRRSNEAILVSAVSGAPFFIRLEAPRPTVRIAIHHPPHTPKDALNALDTGDRQVKSAIDKARRIAGKSINLLLQGESGVGKEVFARAVHAAGPRQHGPFIAVNCAGLPDTLIEAELFGYSAGAFTGARKGGAKGRIREAHGGTLFLDEIGDMPLPLQARLLRVLQDRTVQPLGESKPVTVDFALVCASHRDLRHEMEAGRFRADLYYRINGLTLFLPPLRDRTDLAALLRHELEDLIPYQELRLSAEVASAMLRYTWPGNLRQMANTLKTACALLGDDEDCIDWQHLPDDMVAELHATAGQPQVTPCVQEENLRQISADAIRRAIASSQGNMSEAARRLGISRSTLYRHMKCHAMAPE